MLSTADQLLLARLESLSETELKVLELAALGYTNKGIAARLSYDPLRISQFLTFGYMALGVPQSDPEINSRVAATNILLRVRYRENCPCTAA